MDEQGIAGGVPLPNETYIQLLEEAETIWMEIDLEMVVVQYDESTNRNKIVTQQKEQLQ